MILYFCVWPRGGGMRRQHGNAVGSPRGSLPKLLGWHTGSVAKSGRRPTPIPCAYRGERGRCTGQAPCYAMRCTVSPVRRHSPVRYIAAPRIGRARVGIKPGAMNPAQRIWSPVHLLGPVYMSPALPMVSPGRRTCTSLTHGVPGSPAQPSAGYSTSPHWPGYGEHSTR